MDIFTLTKDVVTTIKIQIAESDVELSAIRSQGSGGQHVNKVSTAIHCRFNIKTSSLPSHLKQRLLSSADKRISKDGIIILKAQSFRTQFKNKLDAIERLNTILEQASKPIKRRIATKPTKGSKLRGKIAKKKTSQKKTMRAKVTSW